MGLQGRPSQSRSAITFDAFTTMANTYAGTAVTADSAFQLPAVYRCVSLNSETVGTMPVDVVETYPDGQKWARPKPGWMTQPNPEYTWTQFLTEVQASLEIDGNAFILKVSTETGRLVDLWHLAPSAVRVVRTTDPKLRIDGRQPIAYEIATDSGTQVVAESAMIHIRAFTTPRSLRGMSPITYAAMQTIGTGLAATQFGAQFFGTGATLSGVVEVPGTLTKEQAEMLQTNMQKKHGGVSASHAIGILSGGATWKQMSVKPEEAQFLETQRYTAATISLSVFGVPPEWVTDVEGAKGYVSGLYARNMMWLQTGINPRLCRIEDAFNPLLPERQSLRFNRNALLRMDPQERAAFYTSGLQGQYLTPDEIRALEDHNPLPDGAGKAPLKSVQYWWPDITGPPPSPTDNTDDEAA
jgi:HK97 family phage portal protein